MTDADLIKLIGSGGLATALIGLLYIVGMRIVRALDRVATKLDEHATADVASHADMRVEISNLHGKIDGLLDGQDRYTPVGVEPPARESQRARTNPHGYAVGAYGPTRPGTKGER